MIIPLCVKCGGERYISSDKNPICKTCRGVKKKIKRKPKEYNQEKINKVKEQNRIWRESNKEIIKIKKREDYLKNKERCNAKSKEWYRTKQHPLYSVWSSMLARCYNSKNKSYKYYGKRGVKVCSRWRDSFSNFLEDMYSSYQKGLTLDRVDTNGDYSPDNCKWSTVTEQNNNRRFNISYKKTVPDDSPIYYPFSNLITLKEFAYKINMPLIVVKYRYTHLVDADYILNYEYDNRHYEYEGHKYTMNELYLISNHSQRLLWDRIIKLNWSVNDAVRIPPKNLME